MASPPPSDRNARRSARGAGLRYVDDGEPGFSRRRAGRGFAYRDARGRPLRSPRQLERIGKLAIPPAYTDVWICADPRGHLQATGRDARGRKQYRYHPRWREDFARLNIEWLERWFVVEPIDREVLGDPQTHLLAGGGRILFAIDADDRALGTVALLPYEDGSVELTKMAVAPELRGGGIGRRLMRGAIEAFVQMGGRELFLESSTKLAPALKLYESVGFRHRPAPRPGSHYQRADVYMVWEAPRAE